MSNITIQEDRLQTLATYAERLVDQKQFASIAWRIEHRGVAVAQGNTGCTDPAALVPVTPTTLYRLYSMTKPVVSVCCLQLIEAGRLRLDDPVQRFIPAFASQQVLTDKGTLEAVHRPITIEDLLTHRSGLSYDFLPDCAVAELYRSTELASDGHRPLEELVTHLAHFPLADQPGSRWLYSYSTDVLAHVIERVCDRPLAECLYESLFQPLGMSETGFQVSDDQHQRVAHMFGQRDLGEVDERKPTSNVLRPMDVNKSYPLSSGGSFCRGGIGLYSSITDYQRFMGALSHGCSADGYPVLSMPMLGMLWQNRLTTSQIPIAIGDKAYAGYGWGLTGRVMTEVAQSATLSSLGEGGWAGAASTYFWVDRRHQFSGIVMAQYLGSAIPLGPDMQSIAYGAICNQL